MGTVAENLQAVKRRIELACRAAGRQGVALLAVSKGHPAVAIREAFDAGQRAFGENYAQEALEKIDALKDLPIEWHFIGPIQSNKTKTISEHFAWVHSVDRLKIAQRLADARPSATAPLQLCLQVNVSGEASKSGVAVDQVEPLARSLAQLPGARLRGLMAIPAPSVDPLVQRAPFATMRKLLQRLNRAGLALDTLSMGMSDDLEAAVAEGATIVRIGTAIFGPRRQ